MESPTADGEIGTAIGPAAGNEEFNPVMGCLSVDVLVRADAAVIGEKDFIDERMRLGMAVGHVVLLVGVEDVVVVRVLGDEGIGVSVGEFREVRDAVAVRVLGSERVGVGSGHLVMVGDAIPVDVTIRAGGYIGGD